MENVTAVTVTPTRNRMIPTKTQANQAGINIASHLTAPTARKAIPRTEITIPARIRPTARATRFANLSAGLAIPPKTSRRTNRASLSNKLEVPFSVNLAPLIPGPGQRNSQRHPGYESDTKG